MSRLTGGGAPSVVTIAGGVGAARFLRGLVAAVPPASCTAVVNVADDVILHGLAISPDLDTVVYTLAGEIDPERGWGLRGETWQAMETVRRYGGIGWFNLGDRDLGTHLYRTQRLRDGAPLSQVTAEIDRAWVLGLAVLPVSDDRVETRVTLRDGDDETPAGGEVNFTGFGKFHVAHRKERQGVNPRTGERITIAASKVPRFSAGSALKKAVKG